VRKGCEEREMPPFIGGFMKKRGSSAMRTDKTAGGKHVRGRLITYASSSRAMGRGSGTDVARRPPWGKGEKGQGCSSDKPVIGGGRARLPAAESQERGERRQEKTTLSLARGDQEWKQKG